MKQLIIVLCAIFATSVAKSDSGMVMSFTNGVIAVVGDSNDSVFGDAARWSLFVTNSASSMALVRAVLRPSQISYNGEKVQGYAAASFEVSVPSQAATNLVYNIPFDSYMPWNDGCVCFQSFLRVESGSEQKFNIFRSGLRMPANLITANYIMDGEGDNGRLESVLSYELPIDSTDLSRSGTGKLCCKRADSGSGLFIFHSRYKCSNTVVVGLKTMRILDECESWRC